MNITREGIDLEHLAAEALDARRLERAIGAILIDQGKLTPADAEKVLLAQRRENLRFGEAALKLGLVTPADINHALSRQFDYAYLMPGDESVSPELIAAFAPFSQHVEGYRALRSQLMLRWFGPEVERRALALVSPGRAEGRSHLAANLAIVFSQLGERTLLIDADLRHPRQHELFRLPNQTGLAAILAGRAEVDAVRRVPSFLDLSVLTAGAVPPNPVELLGRTLFAQLLERWSEEYDVILIDTPAGIDHPEVQTLAVRAGAALVLARQDRTRARAAAELVSRLTGASAAIVGTVLTSF